MCPATRGIYSWRMKLCLAYRLAAGAPVLTPESCLQGVRSLGLSWFSLQASLRVWTPCAWLTILHFVFVMCQLVYLRFYAKTSNKASHWPFPEGCVCNSGVQKTFNNQKKVLWNWRSLPSVRVPTSFASGPPTG